MPEDLQLRDQIHDVEKEAPTQTPSSIISRNNSHSSESRQSNGSTCSHSSHGSFERPSQECNPPCPELIRATTTASSAGPMYSVFTTSQKRFIVVMASWAGFFSPVSGQIYFPALNALATDLHVSNSLINLTLTSYMIFQGLAPSLIGDFADTMGRRPAYFICFIIYIAANIGLALQNSYPALFVLRCIQSSGSSGTIAMASGVVSDISTVSERGSYMGFTLAGSLLGPAIGPVLGGILAQFLGWRSIFWFLTIMGAAFLVVFAIFFPETARNQVGNGSIPPKGYNMSLMNYLAIRKLRNSTSSSTTSKLEPMQSRDDLPKTKFRFPNPLASLHILWDIENALLLLYNALLFASFYDITASIPSQFSQIYGFNDLQIGLCYLPAGAGSMCAALTNGQLLDRNFKRWCRNLNVPIRKGRQQDLSGFPIEKARLQIAIPAAYVTCAMVLVFGWVLDVEGPLAVLLVVLFFTTFSMSVAFNVTSTLLVDFYPDNSATAQAANNLGRCLLGAGATAAVVPMIESWGRGLTFTFLAALLGVGSPMLWAVYWKGMTWRARRKVREDKERERKRGQRDKRDVEAVVAADEESSTRAQDEYEKNRGTTGPEQNDDNSRLREEKEKVGVSSVNADERKGEASDPYHHQDQLHPWHPNTLDRTLSHRSAG